jgi:glycogen operon protein
MEENSDGADDNISWNCGEEGPTQNREILSLRYRQMRNFLATLLISQGVPMISGGDEFGRTQKGNNNAYCQDNEITWYDWNLRPEQKSLLDFFRKLLKLRKSSPVLKRRKFFHGRPIRGSKINDISWFSPSGQEMTDEEWNSDFVRSIGVRLAGDAINEVDAKGNPLVGNTLLMIFNAHFEPVPFVLPAHSAGIQYCMELNTATDTTDPEITDGGDTFIMEGRSMAIFSLKERPHLAVSKKKP